MWRYERLEGKVTSVEKVQRTDQYSPRKRKRAFSLYYIRLYV